MAFQRRKPMPMNEYVVAFPNIWEWWESERRKHEGYDGHVARDNLAMYRRTVHCQPHRVTTGRESKYVLQLARRDIFLARLATGFLRIEPPPTQEDMYQRLKTKILAKPGFLTKIAESLKSDDIVD